jgi:hypothetical protein
MKIEKSRQLTHIYFVLPTGQARSCHGYRLKTEIDVDGLG